MLNSVMIIMALYLTLNGFLNYFSLICLQNERLEGKIWLFQTYFYMRSIFRYVQPFKSLWTLEKYDLVKGYSLKPAISMRQFQSKHVQYKADAYYNSDFYDSLRQFLQWPIISHWNSSSQLNFHTKLMLFGQLMIFANYYST